MLINKAISNLFSGVSQQPISTRLTTYAELQENGYSTVIDGLKKRPNTNMIGELKNIIGDENSFVHFIDRDEEEKYILVISRGEIKVYDLTGKEMTVNIPEYTPGETENKDYLIADNPYKDFCCTTIADYTIIANKTKTIESWPNDPDFFYDVAYFVVKSNVPNIEHRVYVDDYIAQYVSTQTQDSLAITYGLAQELRRVLPTNDYGVSYANNVISVVKTTGQNFTKLEVADGWGDSALACLNNGVDSVTDLPTYMAPEFIVKIKGAYSGSSDDYYVKFEDGVWKETVKFGQTNIKKESMPRKLVRTGFETFTFDFIRYDARASGDDDSCPLPSFVGRKINDVFFHKNRLGFLSDENVILSRNGSYFNFWQQSKATGVLDTDPIDVGVSGINVNILKHATSFNNTLLLFSDNTQFQLTTSNNQPLTPKTVTINPTTKYKTDNLSKPIGIGQDVYFSVGKGNYTGFMEYFLTPGTFSSEASDITQHVPRYIPKNVYKLIGSSIFDILISLNKTNKNEMHIYKFLWQGNEKAQTSWSVWKFAEDEQVVGGEIINNLLYVVIKKRNNLFLEYIDLQSNYKTDNFDYPILLDNLIKVRGTYDAFTNRTNFALPYSSNSEYVMINDRGQTLEILYKQTIDYFDVLSIYGNHEGAEYYVGNTYVLRLVLSELILKDDNGVSIYEYKLKLKSMKIHYSDSGYFKVNITPLHRDTSEVVFTGNNIGVNALIGNINIASGFFPVALMCGSQGLKIELINDKFIPCSFQSIEWNTKSSGNFQRR